MNKDLLPEEILLRTKEAFSDGVSSVDRSWYTIIAEKIKSLPRNDKIYIHNPPQTNEQIYYRTLFEEFYPNMGEILPYWMPKWVEATDPSARTIN